MNESTTGNADRLAGLPELCDDCWELALAGIPLNELAAWRHEPVLGLIDSWRDLPKWLLALAAGLATWGLIAWLLVELGVVR